MTDAPLISLVTPVRDPDPALLARTMASVQAQAFGAWEWVLVDDCSEGSAVRKTLRGAASDRRVRVVERTEPGGDAVAANDALAVARGLFVALLDAGDVLAPDALARVAAVLEEGVDLVYTDEDTIGPDGNYHGPFRKPDWSPERLLAQAYTGHLTVMRRSLVAELGGLRPEFEDAASHDLALRVGERARTVVHVPEVLYHGRTVPGLDLPASAHDAGRRAVAAALERRGIAGDVVDAGRPGLHQVVRRLDPTVTVSLVIPTMGSRAIVWGREETLVVESVRSALAATDHPHVEVVVVYDDHMDPGTLDELRAVAGDRLVAVRYTKRFNFSEKINLGAVHATGDVVVLLNDDVRVRSHGWLEQLVAPLADPTVGMTGAKLYFADGTVQHAGHCYRDGLHGHPYIGWDGDSDGVFGALRVNREVSGVTAACAALRKEVFAEIGGLTETLPVNYNDVDLSYKVRHLGYRILFVANCELYHFESKSREPGVIQPWEKRLTTDRWGWPGRDPYMPDRLD